VNDGEGSPATTKRLFLGTHRVCPPEETWARLVPLLGVAGITRIADITSFDTTGIPIYQAIRPRSRGLCVSQGKGVTPLLSRISAVMEALEWLHAEDVRITTVRGQVGDMNRSLSYELDSLNPLHPSLLNDDLAVDWLPARFIGIDRETFVPLEFVNMSSVVSTDWSPTVFPASSTGLCSGNTFSEAVTHGLYETIERDCIHDLEDTPDDQRIYVDHGTIDGESGRVLGAFLAAANDVDIVDATNSLEVPCFHVRVRSPAYPLWCIGSGAHLDPDVALCRALTEAAQSRVASISGIRDDEAGVWELFTMAAIADQPLRDRKAPFRCGSHTEVDIERDVNDLAERVTRKTGCRPFVVDLSRSDIGIAVGKVVTPGLGEPEQH
jgi:ribosomal protein S12 methylthiotransferase accessory factor